MIQTDPVVSAQADGWTAREIAERWKEIASGRV
jgi:hypothetical protein